MSKTAKSGKVNRRRYSEEFKRDAVELVTGRGFPQWILHDSKGSTAFQDAARGWQLSQIESVHIPP